MSALFLSSAESHADMTEISNNKREIMFINFYFDYQDPLLPPPPKLPPPPEKPPEDLPPPPIDQPDPEDHPRPLRRFEVAIFLAISFPHPVCPIKIFKIGKTITYDPKTPSPADVPRITIGKAA